MLESTPILLRGNETESGKVQEIHWLTHLPNINWTCIVGQKQLDVGERTHLQQEMDIHHCKFFRLI